MTSKEAGREAFLKEAGKRYDEMMSRAGPAGGDTFDDIEAQAEGAGRTLILKLLKERLAAEASAEPESALCEQCGQAMRRPKKEAARNLDTASGTVSYERPHAICDRCGVSFSPSRPAIEDSPSGGQRAPDAQGLRGQRGRVV